MPYQWTAERERQMLLLAVSASNLKPSAETWTAVAGLLGEGLSPSAVSQKYYKMRRESSKLYSNGVSILTPPSTPTKRKISTEDDDEVKPETPTKRVKKSVRKVEAVEAGSSSHHTSFSDYPIYENFSHHVPFPLYEMRTMPMKEEEVNSFSVQSENI